MDTFAIITQVLRIAVPYLFAAAGGVIAERSGIISLTLEGYMLGGAFAGQSSKQTATGYEKTETVDGRMVSEKWDDSDHSGSYGAMVASRFMVAAEGNAPSIDTLKHAVGSIDLGKLEALAK